jgi:hypothetical protein
MPNGGNIDKMVHEELISQVEELSFLMRGDIVFRP